MMDSPISVNSLEDANVADGAGDGGVDRATGDVGVDSAAAEDGGVDGAATDNFACASCCDERNNMFVVSVVVLNDFCSYVVS